MLWSRSKQLTLCSGATMSITGRRSFYAHEQNPAARG